MAANFIKLAHDFCAIVFSLPALYIRVAARGMNDTGLKSMDFEGIKHSLLSVNYCKYIKILVSLEIYNEI